MLRVFGTHLPIFVADAARRMAQRKRQKARSVAGLPREVRAFLGQTEIVSAIFPPLAPLPQISIERRSAIFLLARIAARRRRSKIAIPRTRPMRRV